MSGPEGFGDVGGPWVCPACRSRIKANPGGTRVIRTVVVLYQLNPDGTAHAVAGEKARVQYYHRPCWRAAVNRFNAEQAEVFHTGDHE